MTQTWNYHHIVRYKLKIENGSARLTTTPYFYTAGDLNTEEILELAWGNYMWYRKVEGKTGTTAYGFPGPFTGTLHFNKYLVSPPEIFMTTY